MKAYIFGAGASASAGYPLASRLLEELSGWLGRCDSSLHWVPWARNRIVQMRETFGSIVDFEGLLGKLEAYGQSRVGPTGPTTYRQDHKDIAHDVMEGFRGVVVRDPPEGFYPQYLRSDLIGAFREFFYQVEERRNKTNAYDVFADRIVDYDSPVITFNYDVALERALARAGKWDVGDGYGFALLPGRASSQVTVYKLHGSVNWFKEPINDLPPPVIFSRDLAILGYADTVDPRVRGNSVGVDNSGTFILPDPRKKFHWERFWAPLWSSAARALRSAAEVFIHGYSMPSSDVRARNLLFENIGKSTAISVHCLRDSENIANEFRNRGFTNVKPFQTMDFEAWTTTNRA